MKFRTPKVPCFSDSVRHCLVSISGRRLARQWWLMGSIDPFKQENDINNFELINSLLVDICATIKAINYRVGIIASSLITHTISIFC